MNPISKLSIVVLCACVAMVMSYGTVQPMLDSSLASGFGNLGYYGYPMVGGFGGGYMGGAGGSSGGIFGTIIFLFIFIVIIQVLFNNNNLVNIAG